MSTASKNSKEVGSARCGEASSVDTGKVGDNEVNDERSNSRDGSREVTLPTLGDEIDTTLVATNHYIRIVSSEM
jgi:hypothetical protein